MMCWVKQEDEGGVGRSSTSVCVVVVQTIRLVEREEEFFANYADSFGFLMAVSSV